MTDDTQPEAMDLADWLEAVGGGPSAKRCAALLREQRARIAELESELEAIGAGGVSGPLIGQPQAMPDLSQLTERGAKAWAGVDAQGLREGFTAADMATASAQSGAKLNYSVLYVYASQHGIDYNSLCVAVQEASAQPSPTARAADSVPAVGNSGFDHQTAADFLSGKTISDEAVRKFVAASRWAHDERAALSATLLAMHGVLTSREAEIALLKQALLEAEAAPQQEAQEPVWDGKLSGAMQNALDALYLECGPGITRDITHQVQKECEAIYTSYTTTKRMYQAARDRLELLEAAQPQPDPFAAPQPAPAPLSDDIVKDAARYRLLRRGRHWSVIDGIGNDLLRAEALDAAMDAASKQGASHDR